MRPQIALASAVALSLSLAACGGDDAGADPDPIAVADYCAAWSDAACAAIDRCGCGVDATMCAMVAPALCPIAEGTPGRVGVDDGSIAYDPVSAARFVARMRDAACGTRPLLCGASGTLCIGLSGEGGPCEATAGCGSELVCTGGRCVRPRELAAACASDLECASGRCDGGACAPKAALGATCSADSQCETGRCDAATERCRDLEPLDGLCTRNEDCASGYCQRAELAGGHCQEPAALLPRGASCTNDEMCADGACITDVCAPALCDEFM
jgi:hypothetical protein